MASRAERARQILGAGGDGSDPVSRGTQSPVAAAERADRQARAARERLGIDEEDTSRFIKAFRRGVGDFNEGILEPFGLGALPRALASLTRSVGKELAQSPHAWLVRR